MKSVVKLKALAIPKFGGRLRSERLNSQKGTTDGFSEPALGGQPFPRASLGIRGTATHLFYSDQSVLAGRCCTATEHREDTSKVSNFKFRRAPSL